MTPVRQRRPRRLLEVPPDRGDGSVSYMAVILLIALVIGALVVSTLPTGVGDRLKAGVCRVLDDPDCDTPEKAGGTTAGDRPGGENGDRPGGGNGGEGQDGAPGEQGDGGRPGEDGNGDGGNGAGPSAPDKDDGNCWSWAAWACSAVDGLRLGTADVLTDAWDGVTFVGCLAHICSHDGFKSNWSGIGALFTTDPRDTVSVIWDEATKKVRDDWNNGHKVRAVFRAVPTIVGTIFGGKGLTKLSKLNKAKKDGGNGGNGGSGNNAPGRPPPPKTPEEAAKQADAAARRADPKAADEALKHAERLLKEAQDRAKQNPTQANQDAVRKAQASVAAARRAAADAKIRAIAVRSPEGRKAHDILNRYGVEVVYVNKGGTYFDPSTNRVVISSANNPSPGDQAQALVHEATHVEFQHRNWTANNMITQTSRSGYVNGMLSEEARSVAREITATREMRASGVKFPKKVYLEDVYDRGYNRAVSDAEAAARKAGQQPLSDAMKQRIGQEGAFKELENEFRSGRIRTSNTGDPYPDYYGKAWDQANGKNP